MKKIYTAISLLLFSSAAYCEYDSYYVEPSFSFAHGETLKVKARDENKGWALIYSKYTNDEFLGAGQYDRESFESLDAKFNVYGVSWVGSAPYSFGYADAGIGVGYATGTWVDNCEKYEQGLWGYSELCDLNDDSGIGIPLHASLSFGKYIGLGVNIDVFLSFDFKPIAQVGFVIPLGGFTR
ncbi:hypothetical protein QWY77_01605 [Thalassotalea ponticola]|uniref:hypothetical protein n=1 Tax=Thalassotalea ponticola TaxID=1523392 RepID=UPI0025B5EB8A|nr:hypothetical protein [Thalassotalea ponticola]MDN3651479.1 hypothetical protein [Thalassotalea ponticola]